MKHCWSNNYRWGDAGLYAPMLVGLALAGLGCGALAVFFVWHANLAADTWLDRFFHLGAFNIAAWLMVLARARQLLAPPPMARYIILAALALALAAVRLVPAGFGAVLAIAVLGAGVLLQPCVARAGREAGWLLLALALSAVMVFLDRFTLPIAPLDAQAVAALLRALGFAVTASGAIVGDGSFRILILTGCSSLAPLGSVILAYVVVKFYLGRALNWTDLPWLLAALLTSIALTEIRLCLMVPSFEAWDWWHNGPGLTVYELVALAAAALFPLLASRPARA
ncbi:MAG TPA: hypothetical protein PLT25_00665 [Acidocella sp.]|nr:hypothetical protein [Acidocella sp.]HQU03205.1 hypothetical protein [Acidocella sp.]